MLQGGLGSGYNATTDAENAASIAIYRERTQQIQLNFVRDINVATNIRDYLLARKKDANRRISLSSPLVALHLQRGDFVNFNHPRLDFVNTRCRVTKVEYVPGRAIEGAQDVIKIELEEF